MKGEVQRNIRLTEHDSKKKFDIVIQNPPYSRSGDAIHLKFVENCLKISNKQVAVFPYTFITVDNKQNKKYKELFNDTIIYVEEVESRLFEGTSMPNVGIYTFDNNKTTDNIEILPLNNNKYNVNSLLSLSKTSDYEKNIMYLFENREKIKICPGVWYPNSKTHSKEECIEILKESCKKYPKDKVYLTCNSINGGMNGRYFTPKNGKIYDNFDKLLEAFYESKIGNGYHVIIFDTIKEAENCKIALNNNVLRFILYRLQDNQRMTINKCYRIPGDIDWSDDKVKTDEGLLEICGCSKDKCKEYADYCKKIIDKVDGK